MNNPLKYVDPSGFDVGFAGHNVGGSEYDDNPAEYEGDGNGSLEAELIQEEYDKNVEAIQEKINEFNHKFRVNAILNTNLYDLKTVGLSINGTQLVGGLEISFGWYSNGKRSGIYGSIAFTNGLDWGLDTVITNYLSTNPSQLDGKFNSWTGSASYLGYGKVYDSNNNVIGSVYEGSVLGPNFGYHNAVGYGKQIGFDINPENEIYLAP
jgi:hypothetical protein